MFKEDVIATAFWAEQQKITVRSPEENPHEFDAAESAFAQACRFGRTHISIESDIGKANLDDLQAYYKRSWLLLKGAHLCVIGHINADTLKPIIIREFNKIKSPAKMVETKDMLHRGPLKATWDLKDQYLVMAWPMFERSIIEYAALIMARILLYNNFSKDYLGYGSINCSTGSSFPEGHMFIITLSLPPGMEAEYAKQALESCLNWLQNGNDDFSELAEIKTCFSKNLLMKKPFLGIDINSQDHEIEKIFNNEIECYQGWSDLEWYHGKSRDALLQNIASMTPNRIREVARKYLTKDRCIICTIGPE